MGIAEYRGESAAPPMKVVPTGKAAPGNKAKTSVPEGTEIFASARVAQIAAGGYNNTRDHGKGDNL